MRYSVGPAPTAGTPAPSFPALFIDNRHRVCWFLTPYSFIQVSGRDTPSEVSGVRVAPTVINLGKPVWDQPKTFQPFTGSVTLSNS